MTEVVATFPGGGGSIPPIDMAGLGVEGLGILSQAGAVLGCDLIAEVGAGRIGTHPGMLQPALTSLWLAALRTQEERGWRVAAVAGHSGGEWTAAIVCGAIALEDGLTILVERGRLLEAEGALDRGGMLVVFGPRPDEVAGYLSGFDGAWLAAENGRAVSILGFRQAARDDLLAVLESHAVTQIEPLQVPFASHDRSLGPVAVGIRALLERIDVAAPSTPFVGCTTGALIADAAGVRDQLTFNILSPVRWPAVMRTLGAVAYGRPFVDLLPGLGMTSILRASGLRPKAIVAPQPPLYTRPFLAHRGVLS